MRKKDCNTIHTLPIPSLSVGTAGTLPLFFLSVHNHHPHPLSLLSCYLFHACCSLSVPTHCPLSVLHLLFQICSNTPYLPMILHSPHLASATLFLLQFTFALSPLVPTLSSPYLFTSSPCHILCPITSPPHLIILFLSCLCLVLTLPSPCLTLTVTQPV